MLLESASEIHAPGWRPSALIRFHGSPFHRVGRFSALPARIFQQISGPHWNAEAGEAESIPSQGVVELPPVLFVFELGRHSSICSLEGFR